MLRTGGRDLLPCLLSARPSQPRPPLPPSHPEKAGAPAVQFPCHVHTVYPLGAHYTDLADEALGVFGYGVTAAVPSLQWKNV